jgi:hypothetical protein
MKDFETLFSEATHQQIDKVVSSDNWQKFRLSLKGLSTSSKLQKLSQWVSKHHNSPQAKLQASNYRGALRRGGQLKALKESLEVLTEAIKLKAKQPLEPKEFISKRKKGAADIQKKAEAKGGAALLTAVHFAAKEKPYEYALKVCEKDNAADLIRDKADGVMKDLKDWSNLTQQRFQHLMGMLEAYGEVYLQLK